MSAAENKAVFLSYASQDAEAVRRIAEALRSMGVEAWFDQNELVGGDAWDAKIRKQIRDCALFVPVISANTQSRPEGYFRREWRLCVERMHDMADDQPFLLPIVIDDTPDAAARVPERFRERQWTRLTGEDAARMFARRVSILLTEEGIGESIRATSRESLGGHLIARPSPPAVAAKTSLRLWLIGSLALAALAIGAWFANQAVQGHRETPPNRVTRVPILPIDEKSLAVLPFRNLTADPANAFFCDGVHEDILIRLATLGDLHVVSRTSVSQYRDTTKTMPQIGNELRVAYLIEGSVQRAGPKVRVTGQLIHAATDDQRWARTYDRDLTDIFAVQSELAQEIAGSLHVVLTPVEQQRLARTPTDNVAAYDLYLQARNDYQSAFIGEEERAARMTRAVDRLDQAVQLDPDFIDAWTRLTEANGYLYFWNYDHTDERLARARRAIDVALRLAPNDPEVLLGLGQYYYLGFRDWSRARSQFELALAARPGDVRTQFLLALVARREGRWADTLLALQTIHARDPRDWDPLDALSDTFVAVRRYHEAADAFRALSLLRPEERGLGFERAQAIYFATGSRQEIDGLFSQGTESKSEIQKQRLQAAWTLGDASEVLRWSDVLVADGTTLSASELNQVGIALLANGDANAVPGKLRAMRIRLEEAAIAQPNNARTWEDLALSRALLGDSRGAVLAANRATEIVPIERDAYLGPHAAMTRAIVLAWTGDRTAAVEALTRLLQVPSPWSVNTHHLRVGLEWAPLRDDLEFQALLNDSANLAPLF